MTEEKCDCPVELKPMEEWVKEEDEKLCRPCLLGPVAGWYADELNAKGHPELAKQLEAAAELINDDDLDSVLTFSRQLDTIKESVEGPLRERLKGFDCYAQTFDPDAEVEQ